MKIPSSHTLLHSALAVLAGGLLFSASTQAAISGINTPGTSLASIQFDDTASIAPPAGITNLTLVTAPWTGAIWAMTLTTDPNTSDTAQGDITAGFAGNTYSVTFGNVLLNQEILNSGFANLIFQFSVEFQLDAAGLPSQPTLYPSFAVNGTVQTGGFASVSGFIDYYGVDSSGVTNVVETVNYGQTFVLPGPFLATVPGVPVNGTTPALGPNSTLRLDGTITFTVDPAFIQAESMMVPEPSASLLALLSLPLLLRRRRA